MKIKTLRTATQSRNCVLFVYRDNAAGWPPRSAFIPFSGFRTSPSLFILFFPVFMFWAHGVLSISHLTTCILKFDSLSHSFGDSVIAKPTHTFVSAVKAEAKILFRKSGIGRNRKIYFQMNRNGIGLCAVQVYPCSIFHHSSWTTELSIGIFVVLVFAVHLL